MNDTSAAFRSMLVAAGMAVALPLTAPSIARAQAAAPSPSSSTQAAARQRGTVKSIAGSTLMLTTDAGQQVTVAVAPTAKIL